MIRGLIGLIVLFGLVCSAAFGRVICVPREAPTIQAGLDSLATGDTVWVARGTYTELLNAPPVTFSLLGEFSPDSSETARPFVYATFVEHADTTPVLNLPHFCRANIENMKFQNGPQGGASLGYRRGIRSQAERVTMRNCILDSTAWEFREEPDSAGDRRHGEVSFDLCQFLHGMLFGMTASSPHVNHCVFSGSDTAIVSLVASGDSSVYNGCLFRDVGNGILLNICCHDVEVSNCWFLDFGPSEYPVVDSEELSGRFVNNRFQNCIYSQGALNVKTSQEDSLLIAGNTFEGCRVAEHTASLGAILVDGGETMDSASVTQLRNNVFIGNVSSNAANDIFVFRGRAELSGNRFCGGSDDRLPAVEVDTSGWWTPWAQVIVHDNIFQNTGIAAVGPWRMDAINNWWGDVSGPYHAERNPTGLGDTIVGQLQFIPWRADTAFLALSPTTSILPDYFRLSVFPNPFNSSTVIRLQVPKAEIVRVELFDVLGRRVRELWAGAVADEKEIAFDGSELASGVYFVRATNTIWNRPLVSAKIVLLK